MPYIRRDERRAFDTIIDEFCENIDVLHPNPGHLNYIITTMCLHMFTHNKSYKTLCMLTGVLENVKQELYRRQFADYENEAIKKNGDL